MKPSKHATQDAPKPTHKRPQNLPQNHPKPKAREAELTEMLSSAQSSLEAMKRLHGAAQNQLFELHARSEEVEAGKQVGGGGGAALWLCLCS